MPLIGTRGAASAQGFGEFAQSGPATYIEDVFSTYLFTATGSLGLSVPNGIDLAGKGGLVWEKCRSTALDHSLADTVRGGSKYLVSNDGSPQTTLSSGYEYVFGSSGYTNNRQYVNGRTYVSWTFREQPKFFDIVTWTGNDTSRAISHSLGSVPGCILVKRVDGAGSYSWIVWHRAYNSGNGYAYLNATNAFAVDNGLWWGNGSTYTAPTSTNFTISGQPAINESGVNYVAYLFAHDAGGFGTSGTDNVISCGSFTTDGSGFATVTLGYEPQWVLVKKTSNTGTWAINDTMRGWVTGSALNTSDDATLFPNVSNAETTQGRGNPTATGFGYSDSASSDYIYIAIRRGPMKTPTSGTSVFAPATATGSGAAATITGGPTPTDFVMYLARDAGHSPMFLDRLRGSPFLNPASTSAESSPSNLYWDVMNGYRTDSNYGNYATSDVREFFKRAPSFMDVVCYTGTGSATTVTHNLTVAPELIIVKCRNQAGWNGAVYAAGSPGTLLLDQTSGAYTSGYYAGCFTSTSSTNFGVNTIGEVNGSGNTYVAWMWASCPGVSKVGSYTGTAGTQTISCGFAARFVLIKRTDSTGSWWVWDTARGMVAGTDPRLALQVANPEVNANWVYTDASGFQIVTTDATVNASGGSYIFLAIA